MNKSIKGVLLSGFVFPGTGHIFLKKYQRGTALIITTLVCILVIVVKTVQQAFSILEKIELDGGPVNIDSLLEMVSQTSNSSDNYLITFATILIAVSWVVGVVDAYRIGKLKDR